MSRDDASNLPPDLRDALEHPSNDEDREPDRRDWGRVWALLGRAAPPDDALPDAEDTWAGVRRHVDEGAEETDRRTADRRPRRPSTRRRARTSWRWGAAVAAVLVLALATWWWTRPVEVTAPAGTTVSRTLPDGSVVELHGDTHLRYPRTFSAVSVLEAERRVVRLQGEAYFEVEPGDRPFVVETPSVRVEVTGTAFSVRSRPGEATDAHVALAEGRVRVTDRAPSGPNVTLRPGQAVTRGPDGALTAVRDTSLERILAWRRGGFAATARPLPTLARALERRFGASIRLDDSISAATRSAPLTLYYTQSAELETILHDVCMARGLTYRPTATGYVLARADDPTSPRSP
jgi:ferric-dicitrate binding protein FerR (iron transport regulator)